MSLRVRVRVLWVWLGCAVLLSGGATAQQRAAADKPAVSRWAVLIGVDNYTELGKLRFAGNDQRALAKQLVASGFPQDQVFLLHDKASEPKYMPFRENIEKQLELVLGLANPGDLLIVGFSGHGVQLEGKSCFCPLDTRLDKLADTLIPLDGIYDRLAKCRATLKLLLVDACRNDVLPAGRRSAVLSRTLGEFAGAKERPPEGILLLASCAPGQVSMEDAEFGHGVFMYYLLEGLRGQAANSDGAVSLARLYDHASLQTKKYVARKFNEFQTPALRGEISGPFEICRSATPGAESKPPLQQPEEVTSADGSVKVTAQPDGEIRGFDPQGNLLWKAKTGNGGSRFGGMVGDGERVFVLQGNALLALKLRTGQMIWRNDLAPAPTATARIGLEGDTVRVESGDVRMVFEVATGRRLNSESRQR